MAYIGREPQIGNYQVCDAISVVNAQAAYTMQVNSVNVIPESVNHMIVSLNGVIQKPGSSYTISSSTITFSSNLATGDSIDFIYLLGNVLDLGTPSDDTVTGAKIVDNAINSEHYTDGSIDTAHIADLNVTTGKIAADAITGAKIADDAINSEHYTDGSIDTAHIADGQVTTAKLATAVFTGATDIGADIVDADLFLMDDGAGGTIRKTTASRLKTYAGFNADAAQIFNESGADVDFRIESDGNDSMFKVDAGNNRIGIGTGTPGGDFEIKMATNVRFVVDDTQDSLPTLKSIQDNDTKNGMRIVADNLNIETQTGSNSPVNRLKIASGGEVAVNDDGAETGAVVLKVKGALNNTVAIYEHRNSSGSQTMILFRDGAIETCGTIGIAPANNTVSYNTSSDYRLKENVDYNFDATSRLKQLKPARFNWKKNPSADKVDGFLAHEVSSIVPEAIQGEKDAFETYKEHQVRPDDKNVGDFKLDENGDKIPLYQGIDQSKLVPLLVKTIQELEVRIKTLEDA